MDSWVAISMEREPSYFKAASLMGESYTLLSEKDDKRVGMFACSYLPVYINGKEEMIGYLGALRVAEAFRHKVRYIKEGFDALGQILPSRATVPFYFTSIATENDKARRLLESNLKGMPTYSPKAQMSTLVISTKKGESQKRLQQATKKDIVDIVTFYNRHASNYQFSPVLSEAWLESLDGQIGLTIEDFLIERDAEGNIVGSVALWDQRGMKQSVIKGYRAPLKQLRLLYNIYAHFTKQMKLPEPGQQLDHLFLAFFAFDEVKVAVEILQEALYLAHTLKGVDGCTLGLISTHPILPTLKRTFKPVIYLTEIETVVLQGEEGKDTLDERLIQPEVALL